MMLDANDREAGLLLNFTGGGKGKTSAALGIALRALGWGWRVGLLQFLKGPRDTGEKLFFARHFPELLSEQYGLGLLSHPGDHAGLARQGWLRAEELLTDFPGELLILDELNNALHHGFLDRAEVIRTLLGRRPGLNVVITGRNAPEELLAICDLVSEVVERKHPYRRGVPARKGLDY